MTFYTDDWGLAKRSIPTTTKTFRPTETMLIHVGNAARNYVPSLSKHFLSQF
jgi:hypothetical protein